MHCGQGVWITKEQYEIAIKTARSKRGFVKNLAYILFEELLEKRTLKGQKSSRTGEQKASLPSREIIAIRGINYDYFFLNE